jgi:hypothetical protein
MQSWKWSTASAAKVKVFLLMTVTTVTRGSDEEYRQLPPLVRTYVSPTAALLLGTPCSEAKEGPLRMPYRMTVTEFRESMRRFLDLRRLETTQRTLNDGTLDGWIALVLVWAAVIATLLAIVAVLLGPAE